MKTRTNRTGRFGKFVRGFCDSVVEARQMQSEARRKFPFLIE